MSQVKTPTCPGCGKEFIGETEDQTPEDGNMAVCLGCGEMSVFRASVATFCQPTADERKRMMQDPQILDMLSISMEFEEHRQYDRQRIEGVVTALVAQALLGLLTPEQAAAAAGKVLSDMGYHTHPGTRSDGTEQD